MLNVGDADLSAISSGLVGSVPTGNGGVITSLPEQGSWGVTSLPCSNTVTVTANIIANWNGGSNNAGNWTLSDLQNAFASALQAVMQNIPTAYQNYSYTAALAGDGGFGSIGAWTCTDPQPTDSGYYIPAAIQITAYGNAPDDTAQHGQVTVTYSTTGDQSGGSACDTIEALNGVLAIFPDPVTSELAAVVGAATGIFCEIIGGS